MTLFSVVFTLQDSRVRISRPNSCNISSNVEAPINEFFGFYTTLSIPDVNLYNHYVQFETCFDYSWLGYKSNIVKNLVLLDNSFDITRRELVL